MSSNVEWYIPNKIVYARLWGDLTAEEWHEISQQIADLVYAGDTPVHVVLDTQAVQKHPLNPKLLVDTTVWIDEPYLGWMLHVTTNPVMKMIASIAIHIVKARYRCVASVDDALNFMARSDDHLAAILRETPKPMFD